MQADRLRRFATAITPVPVWLLCFAALGAVTGHSISGLGFIPGRAADEICLALAACAAGMILKAYLPPRQPPSPHAPHWNAGWRFLRACAVTAAVFSLLAGLALFMESLSESAETARSEGVALAFVAAFSGLVGYAELAQRYRDDPARLFAFAPTTIYICVNLAAGIAAFGLVRSFAVFDTAKPHAAIYEVLLASFGAIAFFRSSLFTARVGDSNVDIGPSTLLKSLLDASDRMINRAQARDRADDATWIMRNVKFTQARAALRRCASPLWRA